MSKPTTTDLSLNPFTTWNGQPVINTVAVSKMALYDHDELLEQLSDLEKQFETDGLITNYGIDHNGYTIEFYFLTKQGFELLDGVINDSLFQFVLSNFETRKAELNQPQPAEAWQHLPTVNQLQRQNFTFINGHTVTNSIYLSKLFDVEHSALGDWLNDLLENHTINAFTENFICDRVVTEVSNGNPSIHYFYYLTKRAVHYLINGSAGFGIEVTPFLDNEELASVFMMAFETAIDKQQPIATAPQPQPKTRTILTLTIPVHFDLLAFISNYPFKHPVFIHCNGQELFFVEQLD